ncbi:MAG: DMT family transporter [Pseudomonadota bacterium]
MTVSSEQIRRGVALIIVTAFAISAQDAVFKQFSSNATLWQIFALRGLIVIGLFMIFGLVRGRFRPLFQTAVTRWSLLRAACLTTTFLAFYAALPFLSLSTVGAANYMAPIFVAILSAFVAREAVSRFVLIGACLGFIGVVVLLRPGSDVFSPLVLLPVMGAAFYAVGHLVTRARCQTIGAASLALSLNATMMGAGLLISALILFAPLPEDMVARNPYIFGPWSPLGPQDWLFLAILAGFAIAISMMLAGAYKTAPPAIVATFEYSYLVFAAGWDILFFGAALTPWSLAGMGLIASAGLLVLQHRP